MLNIFENYLFMNICKRNWKYY